MISGISSVGGYANAISSSSVQQRQEQMFAKVDSNGDGSIDKAEFSEFAQKIIEMTGESADVDELLSQFDANSDGAIDQDEADVMFEELRPPKPPDGGGAMPMGSMPVQQRQEQMFTMIDTNGDGSIDKDELAVMAEKMSEMTGESVDVDELLAQFDANEDGAIDQDEAKMMFEELRPPKPPEGSQSMAAMSMESDDQIQILLDALKQSEDQGLNSLYQQYTQSYLQDSSTQNALLNVLG